MALFFKEKSEGDWKLNSIMKRKIDINELERLADCHLLELQNIFSRIKELKAQEAAKAECGIGVLCKKM